ncbi:nucleotidyltransferase family protein [[Ruminococcus] lactaris]|nr:nucleotidyltransferase family protein [[Ruminococcus] lactaris]
MENDEWQERRRESVNEKDTMKNSRKTNVKSNTSDIEAKEKKEQQEQEKILAAKYLIELIRSVLEERKPQPKPEKVSMKQLFLTAKNNNLICMAYDAFRQIAEPEDADIMKKWQKTSQSCTVMDVVQRSEGNKIFRAFIEQGEIRILPMKGWIMKGFYPRPEYRQMGDLDFLIDRENRKKARDIMCGMGYRFVKNECDDTVDVYKKEPWMYVEIHNHMTTYKNKTKYEKIWERCEKKDGLYVMNWDDYYMFMLDHLEKHFYSSGCGVRFLLDLFIFMEKKGKELHRDVLEKEFRIRGEENFFEQLEKTALSWFGKEYHVGDTRMEKLILVSGAFGTDDQKYANRQAEIQAKYKNEKSVKTMYFLTRVFPEYSYMCNIYPVLYKVPVLMPVMWIVRLLCAPVTKMDRIRKEVRFWKNMGKKE